MHLTDLPVRSCEALNTFCTPPLCPRVLNTPPTPPPPFLFAEHVAARFGTEDSRSYVAFTVDEDLGRDLSVSLFLRTRRQDGLVLALANGSSHFLDVWLEDGKVTVQLDRWESLRSQGAVDDGQVHFVSAQVAGNRLTLYVGDEKQGETEVGSAAAAVRAGDAVHVGGLPLSRATSVFGGYFKGCIQDLRVNDRRLQIFGTDASEGSLLPRLLENVTAGCSGDNICGVSAELVFSRTLRHSRWNEVE